MGRKKKILEPIPNSSFYSMFISSTNTDKVLNTPSKEDFNKKLEEFKSEKDNNIKD